MKYTATALYVQPHNSIFGLMSGNSHCVAAKFHDELQIVYEGLSRAECLAWCHSQGIGMKKAESYRGEVLATFDSADQPKTDDEPEQEAPEQIDGEQASDGRASMLKLDLQCFASTDATEQNDAEPMSNARKHNGLDCLDALPTGWKFREGANCAPRGYILATNGKSIFSGEYRHAWVKLPEQVSGEQADAERPAMMKLDLQLFASTDATEDVPEVLPSIVEEWHFVQAVKVTVHNKGSKMDGFQSINTSALVNPICKARRGIAGSVCEKCYASNLLAMRGTLENRCIQNGQILQRYLISEQAWAFLPVSTIYARIEAFGDVANVTQARNYIRIIKAHHATNWGIWSKNASIWAEAFRLEGKPVNCTYVHSSMMINTVEDVPQAIKPFTDHRFTVWDRKSGHEINCGGLHCSSCLRCYKSGTDFDVHELKK